MKDRSVVEQIVAFNHGRDPERLRLKYQAMSASPLAFLRGSCHLFYATLPHAALLEEAPPAWISGDLHVGNFGTYKGDNRQVYFDLNDFDEAALAPCTWDMLRLVLSVLVAAGSLRIPRKQRRALGEVLIDAYADALTYGKARWVERETAEGVVRGLLDQVRHRNRKQFLDSRTEVRGGKRLLLVDGKRTLAASKPDRKRIMAFMKEFARSQTRPAFFKPLDVARRIAGTGSLGLERYAILVEGHGPPAGNLLLDHKYQPAPALASHLKLSQPHWKSEAERVIAIQRRAQAIAPAFLTAVKLDTKSFLLKEAQPTSDKVDLVGWEGTIEDLRQLVHTLGQLVAWSHLRASGREGSAIADQFIQFGGKNRWRRELLELGGEMAPQLEEDWRTFRAANLGNR